MIKYVAGDILKANCQALVNPVNCVGVMGKGLALQFKKKYPKMFKSYIKVCNNGGFRPGDIYVYDTELLVTPQFIFNFATKNHWNSKSKIEYIEKGLESVRDEILWHNIATIALPALGCGEGGLKWEDVKRKIDYWLNDLELEEQKVEVFVYLPKELYGTST